MNYIEALQVYLSNFIEHCCKDKVPYEPRGILNIEAFYWWALVAYYKPDIILESGVFLGRSTEVLARAQKFYNIPYHFAFDIDDKNEAHVRNKLKGYKTEYKIISSVIGFQEVLDKYPDKRVVAIIDGPKSGKPFKSLFKILSKFQNCCAVASHDCMPSSKIPPVFSEMCKKQFPNGKVIFTKPEMNTKISLVNDFIANDIITHYTDDRKKFPDLISRSDYVGICFNLEK